MDDTVTALRRGVAERLLSIGAVSFSPHAPFIWASGLRSPIYCDNRLTASYPAVRRYLCDAFATLAGDEGLAPEVVVGTATAGIPHAAWLAERLDLPMAYVRSKAKAHGRRNQIEGLVARGQRVVVVEDLISTGASSLGAVEAVREAGADVAALLAIFTYGLDVATDRFAAHAVRVLTLTDVDALLAVAADRGDLDEDEVASLRRWHHDPAGWSASHS